MTLLKHGTRGLLEPAREKIYAEICGQRSRSVNPDNQDFLVIPSLPLHVWGREKLQSVLFLYIRVTFKTEVLIRPC